MVTGEAAGAGADNESLSSETVVAVVGIVGAYRLLPAELPWFVGEVGGVNVGKVEFSAIVARFSDVTPLMFEPGPVDCDVGVALLFGPLVTFVGEFDTTGVGFTVTGVGRTATGVGFIGGAMEGVHHVTESRPLTSSVSTEMDAVRFVRRAIILRRSCS